MVQSKAATVDDFMTEVAPDRRPALDRVRAMCLERFGLENERMAGVDRGGGCARWRKPEKMDFDLIANILDHIRDRGRGAC